MHGRTQPLVAKDELWPGMRPSMIASPQSDTVARPTPSEPERTSVDKPGLNETVETKQRVGIIGTGNYAQALVKRLTGRTGCDVIIGSRKPVLRRETLSAVVDFSRSVRLASIEDCIESSDIVILAIHLEDFHTTLQEFAHLLTGKIVVDVSNRESRNVAQSNAEYLSSILPCATVVKAFNSVSAYTMEDISETSVVYVSGNDVAAREKVMTLAQAMGFQAINFGLLTSAGLLEDNNLTVFSLWKIPVAIATGVFTLFSLLVVYMQFIDKRRPGFWHQIFLYVLNKPVCLTAMTTLALTYLPGNIFSLSFSPSFLFIFPCLHLTLSLSDPFFVSILPFSVCLSICLFDFECLSVYLNLSCMPACLSISVFLSHSRLALITIPASDHINF